MWAESNFTNFLLHMASDGTGIVASLIHLAGGPGCRLGVQAEFLLALPIGCLGSFALGAGFQEAAF